MSAPGGRGAQLLSNPRIGASGPATGLGVTAELARAPGLIGIEGRWYLDW